MKKFKNVKTGNIIHVNDKVAGIYTASKQYVEVDAKGKEIKKPENPEKPAE